MWPPHCFHFPTPPAKLWPVPYQGFSVTGYIRADRGRLWAYKWRFKQPLLVHTSLMICPLTYMCLTHPVNFPCGRKPTTFGRALTFYSFHMRTGFESHWESSHWGLNLRPSRWKPSALTTWPPEPHNVHQSSYLLYIASYKSPRRRCVMFRRTMKPT